MKIDQKFSWQIEIIAIIIGCVVMILFMLPVFKNVPDFPFMLYNISTILTFLILVRYLFLLRFVPFARFTPIKIVLIFLMIPLLIFLIDGLSEFQNQLDEEGTYSMVSHLPIDIQIPLSKYIRSEMIFFAVAAIVSAILIPIRMIISIWRVMNRNTV